MVLDLLNSHLNLDQLTPNLASWLYSCHATTVHFITTDWHYTYMFLIVSYTSYNLHIPVIQSYTFINDSLYQPYLGRCKLIQLL